MRKYNCQEGEFKCKICGTIYKYSDLRDACEGSIGDLKFEGALITDKLQAEIGERILRTQYHGNDYAPKPYKQGLFLTYTWETVRDKRIVPAQSFSPVPKWPNMSTLHWVCYKIGEHNKGHIKFFGDTWDIPAIGGGGVGIILGPHHFWSQRAVENLGKTWPDYVIEICEGERSHELLSRKAKEGYEITGYTRTGEIEPE